jgi:hypothetical protein
MWIKASGIRLADVTQVAGFVKLDLPVVKDMLDRTLQEGEDRHSVQESSTEMVMAAVRSDSGLRPSLETLFHAALGKVVLHTHPVVVNGLACMEEGQDALSRGIDFHWVPYAPPGVELGAMVAGLGVAESEGVLIFQNHGLVVHCDDVQRLGAVMNKVLALAGSLTGPVPSDCLDFEEPPGELVRWADTFKAALTNRYPGFSLEVKASKWAVVNRYGKDPELLGKPGALVPDDVVYGIHRLLEAELSGGVTNCIDQLPEFQPDRLAVAVRGGGTVFAAASNDAVEAMEETLLAHILIRILIARQKGRPVYLPEEEIRFIEAMESEKYRRRIASRSRSSKGDS